MAGFATAGCVAVLGKAGMAGIAGIFGFGISGTISLAGFDPIIGPYM